MLLHPTMKGLSGQVRRGDLQYHHIELRGCGARTGIQMSVPLSTRQLPCLKAGVPPPPTSHSEQFIIIKVIIIITAQEHVHPVFHGNCVLSEVQKDQTVGSAELLAMATAKLGGKN